MKKEQIDFEKDKQRKEYLSFEYPKSVNVGLAVSKCIYRCRMCPQYNNPPKENNQISFKVWKKIVDQLPDREIKLEICSYGETLLCNSLIDLIRYAKTTRPKANIIMATNGFLLNEEMGEKIIDSGLDWLSFSLDAGSPESYKWLCCSDGYEKVTHNLMNLVKLRSKKGSKNPKITTHIIGIKELEHEFDSFLGRWRDVVDSVSIRAFGNWGGLVANNDCTPLWTPPEERYPCVWLWYATMVNWNGDFLKCCMDLSIDNYEPLGNITNESIGEAWHGKSLNKLRDYHLRGEYQKVPLCDKCNVWALFPNVWHREGKNIWR